MLITFVAGFVLEFISIMIIIVPVAVAVLRPMGVDDVWFCILFLIVIQTMLHWQIKMLLVKLA